MYHDILASYVLLLVIVIFILNFFLLFRSMKAPFLENGVLLKNLPAFFFVGFECIVDRSITIDFFLNHQQEQQKQQKQQNIFCSSSFSLYDDINTSTGVIRKI